MKYFLALSLAAMALGLTACSTTLPPQASADDERDLPSWCDHITAESFLHPTRPFRRNVCFKGIYISDREWSVVIPFAKEKPSEWDVAVFVPPMMPRNVPADEEIVKAVRVMGDIKYQMDCWLPAKEGEDRICIPVSRPISVVRGKVVPLSK